MFAKPNAATKPSLTLRRRLNAAPAKVYSAWTDPAHLTQWFGPAGAEAVEAETDVRVGGRFHITFRSPDGEGHDVSGVYREVVADEKLVFTWMWKTLPDRPSLVTITLKRDGVGTELTLFHEQFYDEAARDGHNYGWTGALDKLEKLFA